MRPHTSGAIRKEESCKRLPRKIYLLSKRNTAHNLFLFFVLFLCTLKHLFSFNGWSTIKHFIVVCTVPQSHINLCYVSKPSFSLYFYAPCIILDLIDDPCMRINKTLETANLCVRKQAIVLKKVNKES